MTMSGPENNITLSPVQYKCNNVLCPRQNLFPFETGIFVLVIFLCTILNPPILSAQENQDLEML